MFKVYRIPEPGEFFCVGGDCSQGGADSNEAHFLSKDRRDIPIVYRAQGVAMNMTDAIFPWLEWVCNKTGVKPVVAFERQNGGASEMERLKALNKKQMYTLFLMPKFGTDKEEGEKETERLGWDTNTATRPKLLGEWKDAVDKKLITIYDEETVRQHKTFVVNKQGKPVGSSGSHDDAVMAPAISWQLYQICLPEIYSDSTAARDAVRSIMDQLKNY